MSCSPITSATATNARTASPIQTKKRRASCALHSTAPGPSGKGGWLDRGAGAMIPCRARGSGPPAAPADPPGRRDHRRLPPARRAGAPLRAAAGDRRGRRPASCSARRSSAGWRPGLSGALFPPESMPFLRVIAEFGIVIFMFLIGLELNPGAAAPARRAPRWSSPPPASRCPSRSARRWRWPLYGELAGAGVSRLGFAGFLGAAMAITAFPGAGAHPDRARSPALAARRDGAHLRGGRRRRRLVPAGAGRRGRPCARGVAGGRARIVWVLVYLALMLVVVRPLLRRLAAVYANRGMVSQNLLAIIVRAAAGQRAGDAVDRHPRHLRRLHPRRHDAEARRLRARAVGEARRLRHRVLPAGLLRLYRPAHAGRPARQPRAVAHLPAAPRRRRGGKVRRRRAGRARDGA